VGLWLCSSCRLYVLLYYYWFIIKRFLVCVLCGVSRGWPGLAERGGGFMYRVRGVPQAGHGGARWLPGHCLRE
jgi:hypothetical protein